MCIFSAAHTHAHPHTLLQVCVCVGVVACSSASHPACMQLVASGYANLGPVNASIQLPYQLLFSESEQIIAQQLGACFLHQL